MAIKRDKIHYSSRNIDGYNLPFNFVISERELGKSTTIILDKVYKPFREHGFTTLVIRRNVNDITQEYIESFKNVINKFYDDNVEFQYSLSSLKNGLVLIKVDGKPFLLFIGLSKKIASIKSLMFPNLKTILFDEFIVNTRFGEKYLRDEATKFMEVYNTFRREGENLKCYFLGNPYSLYNPYFIFFNVDSHLIKRGVILSDKKTYVLECAEMSQELRDYILSVNPLYQFDNAYTRYAFEGVNINDENIIIQPTKPSNYALKFVFKANDKFLGVWRNNDFSADMVFYINEISLNTISNKRDIYCFDFDELVDRTILISLDDRYKFEKLKKSMRERKIAFSNLECYYIFEEIYFNL